MRKELAKLKEERKRFKGEFVRMGIKSGYMGRTMETILIKNVTLDDCSTILTDHLWFNNTKLFAQLKLNEGDIVEFNGRCKKYIKGYQGYREDVYNPVREDYKISHPTKVLKVFDVKSI